ncbi:MAG: outer membrane protein assembly factor BamA, partial [Cytophagales bacterium]
LAYNRQLGQGPFERFVLGGSGLTGFNFLLGYDLIGLRGYQDRFLQDASPNNAAGVAFNKYVTEIRYPISLNPMATLYVLGFAEAGNATETYSDFDPFKLYRSAGVGARIFMPAFGMIGVDYGIAFDNVPGNLNARNPFTFTIGQQIR